MQNFLTTTLVVAAALIDTSGRVLLQKRRMEAVHGGLWEFPGGKVEVGESPEIALVREISEELGIELGLTELTPVTFANSGPDAMAPPLVILLYKCTSWTGTPRCLDADAIGWFTLEELGGLAMPPLDYPLARALVSSI